MSLGARAQRMATRLITNGRLWTHDVTFEYGPRRSKANPYDEASTATPINPATIRVAAFPEEKAMEDGGQILSVWKIIVPAAGIAVAPTTEDTVKIGGVVHAIIDVDPITVNATEAVYTVWAER